MHANKLFTESTNGLNKNKNATQCAERILNKSAKAINETFAGLKLMLQGFRIYFV